MSLLLCSACSEPASVPRLERASPKHLQGWKGTVCHGRAVCASDICFQAAGKAGRLARLLPCSPT